MSDSNQRSKTLIRELYQLSESGAFNHLDQTVADQFCESVKTFLNPVLTYNEAAKATGKSLHGIYSKVSRSGIKVYERMRGLRWSDVKKIIDKRI